MTVLYEVTLLVINIIDKLNTISNVLTYIYNKLNTVSVFIQKQTDQDMSHKQIYYSDKYDDDKFEYR